MVLAASMQRPASSVRLGSARSVRSKPAVSKNLFKCKSTEKGADKEFPSEQVLSQVIRSALAGDLTPEQAASTISQFAAGVKHAGDLASLNVASTRERTGFPEVVWGPGKSAEQIVTALNAQAQHQRLAIATRIERETFEEAIQLEPELDYHEKARIMTLRSPLWDQLPKTERLPGTVAVVSAGTADARIVEETRLVAELLGCYVFRIPDVGVAGLHRVVYNLPALRAADVVVVVTGMDGALPTVVAGLVEAPVISVPTSVGYGAALAGMAPLLSSLNAAPGVSVVNIDNGFGAAMMAARTLKMFSRLLQKRAGQQQLAQTAAAQQPAASANGTGHS